MVETKRVRINGEPARSLKQPVKKADRVEVTDVAPSGRHTPNTPSWPAASNRPPRQRKSSSSTNPPASSPPPIPSEKRPYVLKMLSNYFKKNEHKKPDPPHPPPRPRRPPASSSSPAHRDAFRSLKSNFLRTLHHPPLRRRRPRHPQKTRSPPRKSPPRRSQKTGESPHHPGPPQPANSPSSAYNPPENPTPRKKNLPPQMRGLFTGRKHQIRVQLKPTETPSAAINFYGKAERTPDRLALHASHLTLLHPGTNRKGHLSNPLCPATSTTCSSADFAPTFFLSPAEHGRIKAMDPTPENLAQLRRERVEC